MQQSLSNFSSVPFSIPKLIDNEDSRTERCVVLLLEEIRLGILPSGKRLGEVGTAKRLKMGRAAVRTAFDKLAWAGVLERIPRGGTFVKPVSLTEYCELIDVRAGLESIAARLAATRMTESELNELEKMAIRLGSMETKAVEYIHSASEQEFKELNDLDSAFHGSIARASGNRRLYELLSMQKLVECCMLISVTLPITNGVRRGNYPSHQDIVDVLRTRDPERSAQIVLEQLMGAKEATIACMSGIVANGHHSTLGDPVWIDGAE